MQESSLPETPTETISGATNVIFKEELASSGWKIAVGIVLLEMVLFYLQAPFEILFIAPVFTISLWYGNARGKAEIKFWKEFAQSHGWFYEEDKSVSDEKALLFRQGDGPTVLHAVRGVHNGQPLSLFEYEYTTGSGKYKTTYSYTIFEIKFIGAFPHLYLNNTKNGNYLNLFETLRLSKLSLPAEFEKKFVLYAPKEYEIEALAIFSPDTLQFLLDAKWSYDLELVESELIIVRESHILGRAELEAVLSNVCGLVDHLSPKLNRFRFSPIGDHPSNL